MDANADLLNELLEKTFAELGATGSVVRTFLLRDRQCVGQGFRCRGFRAVLLVGKKEIEFYDEGGVLLRTVSLEETEKKSAA